MVLSTSGVPQLVINPAGSSSSFGATCGELTFGAEDIVASFQINTSNSKPKPNRIEAAEEKRDWGSRIEAQRGQ
jgi:hypothetical protein